MPGMAVDGIPGVWLFLHAGDAGGVNDGRLVVRLGAYDEIPLELDDIV